MSTERKSNRFKKSAEMLEASTKEEKLQTLPEQEEHVGKAQHESVVSLEIPAEELGATVAERYAKLYMADKQEKNTRKGKERIHFFVPAEIKKELEQMVERQEIKNISHFMNYLIADYLATRDQSHINNKED